MYSVVLMMAMTSGGDAPAGLFHKHSCCGTTAPVATCAPVAPVYVSCGGGCAGTHHKLFGGHKHHSCCGAPVYAGCTGYVATPYAGCVGSPYSPGCVGTPPVTPTPKPEVTPNPKPKDGDKPLPKPEEKPKGTSAISAPATLVVNVPENAILTVDGNATTATSAQRVFESPELVAGREFHYTVTATFTSEGKQVTVSKFVAVSAGNQTVVDFNTLAVASR